MLKENNATVTYRYLGNTKIESFLEISQFQEEYAGKYSCIARNKLRSDWGHTYNLLVHCK